MVIILINFSKCIYSDGHFIMDVGKADLSVSM